MTHDTGRRPNEEVWTRVGGERQDQRHNRDELVHHATRRESRMVRATMPFPAKPMETKIGLLRPGTGTLRTSIE
jgi:hypothetical protein